MKKETPHSSKCRAGLADGLTTVAPVTECLPRGETKAKRSPKEQSAVSGTLIQVLKVVLNCLGRDHATRRAKSDGSAPASKIVGGMGTTSPDWRGWSSYAFSSGSLQPANAGSTDTGLSLEGCNFEKRKWIATEMNGLGNNTPTISEIQTVVAGVHGCTKADIIGKGRKRHESTPRMEAAALARELTGHSLPLLGRHFGGRDHTTILYSCRKVADRAMSDPKMRARLDECRAQLAVIVAKRAGRTVMQSSSSDWSPPPPSRGMALSKPSTVIASIDGAAWLVCAA
jgi:hypothetical protein